MIWIDATDHTSRVSGGGSCSCRSHNCPWRSFRAISCGCSASTRVLRQLVEGERSRWPVPRLQSQRHDEVFRDPLRSQHCVAFEVDLRHQSVVAWRTHANVHVPWPPAVPSQAVIARQQGSERVRVGAWCWVCAAVVVMGCVVQPARPATWPYVRLPPISPCWIGLPYIHYRVGHGAARCRAHKNGDLHGHTTKVTRVVITRRAHRIGDATYRALRKILWNCLWCDMKRTEHVSRSWYTSRRGITRVFRAHRRHEMTFEHT